MGDGISKDSLTSIDVVALVNNISVVALVWWFYFGCF